MKNKKGCIKKKGKSRKKYSFLIKTRGKFYILLIILYLNSCKSSVFENSDKPVSQGSNLSDILTYTMKANIDT